VASSKFWLIQWFCSLAEKESLPKSPLIEEKGDGSIYWDFGRRFVNSAVVDKLHKQKKRVMAYL